MAEFSTKEAAEFFEGNKANKQAALHFVRSQMARRSLLEFMRLGWSSWNPPEKFQLNWHHEVLAEHLEAFFRREIQDLIINIPPGASKSVLCSVMFPCWAWLQNPRNQFLVISYKFNLVLRDSRRTRDLVGSDWFRNQAYLNDDGTQTTWGEVVKIRQDVDRQDYFETTAGGARMAVPVLGEATAWHPDFIIGDDVMNPQMAGSTIERSKVNNWWSETLATRGVGRNVGQLIVQQRLHPSDLTGHLLEQGGYTLLRLPMEYDPSIVVETPRGWPDKRSTPGEPLWEDRFPTDVIDKIKKRLGSAHRIAGQLQQMPTAPSGEMFVADWFVGENLWVKPEVIESHWRFGRFWDMAASVTKDADYTVGALLAFDGRYFYVVDIVRGKWRPGERDDMVLRTTKKDVDKYRNYRIRVEFEGGSGGVKSKEDLIRRLAGYPLKIEKPPTGKPKPGDTELKRWESWATALEENMVRFVLNHNGEKPSWWEQLLEEHLGAPNARHDDILDSVSGAHRHVGDKIGKRLNRPLLIVGDPQRDRERKRSSRTEVAPPRETEDNPIEGTIQEVLRRTDTESQRDPYAVGGVW